MSPRNRVAWDIIHRAGGSEVIRYENGNPVSVGVFLGRNEAWEALNRDRLRLFPVLGVVNQSLQRISEADSLSDLVEERSVIESWADER
jgi:hypothetical protein